MQHSLAVDSAGFCFSWGTGAQLGLEEVDRSDRPVRIPALLEVVTKSIACGDQHSLALVAPRTSTTGAAYLNSDNAVMAWGQV